MAITVFNRYEMKYMLSPEKYKELRDRIDGLLIEDSYGLHTICNLYYDTDDYRLIRMSIDRPLYKEKLRLRSYGVPAQHSDVFLEIKKKFDSNVNKRRVVLPLEDAYSYLEGKTDPVSASASAESGEQIMREIDFLKNRYDSLRARVFIAYDRTALFGADDPSFRITFDQNVRSRNDSLRLEKGDGGKRMIKDGYRLMEVKMAGAMPLWFARVLSELEIYKISYSKYGNVYENDLTIQTKCG